MTQILEKYKREMNRNGGHENAFLPISKFFNGFRLEIPPGMGKGCHEVLEIDSGLCISLSNYLLDKPVTNHLQLTQSPLRFNILLSGTLDFQLDSETRQRVSPGDIWVWNDLTGNIFRTLHSVDKMCGITLTFPQHLMESWLGNDTCEVSRNLEKMLSCRPSGDGEPGIFPLARQLPQANQIMNMARNLFGVEKNTLYGKLRFESQSLDFLCGLLSLDFGKSVNKATTNWKIKVAVDDAVDILCREWDTPPSISTLARRIGINESYLKNGFRNQMGCTIGEFVRRKRMEKALELIESGKYSILETALFVGYANPSHFASVFKKFYGHLPSYYVRFPSLRSSRQKK